MSYHRAGAPPVKSSAASTSRSGRPGKAVLRGAARRTAFPGRPPRSGRRRRPPLGVPDAMQPAQVLRLQVEAMIGGEVGPLPAGLEVGEVALDGAARAAGDLLDLLGRVPLGVQGQDQ